MARHKPIGVRRTAAAAALLVLSTVPFAACESAIVVEDDTIRWAAVTTGFDHACAADTRGNVFCWGSNETQQLSQSGIEMVSSPVPALIATDVETVHAGLGYSCKLARTGVLTCWGEGRVGQLGNGIPVISPIGVRTAGGPWSEISTGRSHACGITSGGAYCWGGEWYGAAMGARLPVTSRCTHYVAGLASNMVWCALEPEPITPAGLVTVSAGARHSCGADAAGAVYCWGRDEFGRLGFTATDECRIIDPVHGDSFHPCAFEGEQVPLSLPATQVEAGGGFTCALATDGSIYCWGGPPSYSGQLGHGGDVGSSTPVRVDSQETFSLIAVSRASLWETACGITTDGRAFCWGANRRGALGADGPDTCQFSSGDPFPCALSPVPVDTDARFVDIDIGGGFVCGLTDELEVLCWGQNDKGQLGDRTTVDRQEPRPVVSQG